MLTIYGGPTFNALKVVLTAEEMGLAYDYVKVDLRKGEQRRPEHLARHPLGKVPSIVHDGKPLFESSAICRYLAQAFESPLYRGDVYRRACIDQMMDMMTCHAGRWLGSLFFQEYIRPNLLKQEPDPEAVAEAKRFLGQQLPPIDKILASSGWLAGGEITVADTFAFPYFQTHEVSSADLSPYPNIERWYQAVSRRPSVAAANKVVNA